MAVGNVVGWRGGAALLYRACGGISGELMMLLYFFFFNDTATTEIYTLSLHDALPIFALKIDNRMRCQV